MRIKRVNLESAKLDKELKMARLVKNTKTALMWVGFLIVVGIVAIVIGVMV